MSDMTLVLPDELEQNPKCYRKRYIPMDIDDLSDECIRSIYRFDRHGIRSISGSLQDYIDDLFVVETLRGKRLTPDEHVVIALKFYGHGKSFRALGEQYGVSLGTVSHVIQRVTNGILCTYSELVQVTTSTEFCSKIASEFYNTADIPNIVGCVDANFLTRLIPIKRPSVNEHVFVCRKGYHAINAMFACRSDLRFTYVNASFPGATQDAGVFLESSLRQAFIDQVIPQGFLLGDSGYGLSRYLLTPVHNATDRASAMYNRAHRRTRNVIERAFGEMKSRFRCLDKSGGPLRLCPRCARIISAVSLLHNLAIEMCLTEDGASETTSDSDDESQTDNHQISISDIHGIEGSELRNNIISMFQ